MTITDFKKEHRAEAAELALDCYKEERLKVPGLPKIGAVPELDFFAENGFGAAAIDKGRLVGFLGAVGPFDNAFRSTKVKGFYSPMGASGATKENRAKIYAAMYQFAGAKWARAGASSHAVCLYAHDEETQMQLFRYGFGIRCVDAVYKETQVEPAELSGYVLRELAAVDYGSVYELELKLGQHMRQSPTFMDRKDETPQEFRENNEREGARFFTALYDNRVCAFIRVTQLGETFITGSPDYRHITGAYCLPEHRGRGVYQNLLYYTGMVLKKEGFNRLGVDFESINPSAWGFWLKYFDAYTYGVVRRIDENLLEKYR